MAFELYVDDVDLDDVGGKPFDRVAPGDYHMLVESIDEEGGKKGEMVVVLQILRGTTPGMESKSYTLELSKSFEKWPLRKLTAFAIATRLTSKELLEKAKAAKEAPVIDWPAAVGRTICMSLEDNEYNGKHYTRLAWDNIWSPIDKRAAHVPLHADALKRDGLALPDGRNVDGILAKPNGQQANGGNGKAQAATKTAASQQSAAAPDPLAGVI